MAKNPGDRYQTAGQLAAAVRDALLGGSSPPGTEPRDGGWDVIPASAWISATEAWQSAGQPPEPGVKPAPASGSPTQTVIAGNFGTSPPDSPPPTISSEPVPDPDHGAPGNPRRRQAGLILAALAAAAVAIVVVILALDKPHTSNQSPAASASRATKGGATATVRSTPAVVPKIALPTAGGTVAVGQDPSFIQVAPNGKFAYITDTGNKTVTVLDTVTDQVSGRSRSPRDSPSSSRSPMTAKPPT